MTLRPVAAYLTRFEDRQETFEIDPPSLDAPMEIAEDKLENYKEPEETALEVAIEEALLNASIEYDEKLALEKKRFADMLQLERDRWIAEEGARLAALFQAGIEEAVEQIQETFARALTPFVARKILDRLLHDFVDSVKIAIEKGNDSAIQLSGPKDLIDIVEARLADASIAVQRIETAGDEILAKVGATSIETCVGSWLQKLENGVGQDG